MAASGPRSSSPAWARSPRDLARKTYAADFFEAGGFVALDNDGKYDVELVAAEFAAGGAEIAVICSTDKQYTTGLELVAPS